jgi:predicted acetyltransferase
MPELVLPTADLKESFLAAMAEFRAEGRGGRDDESMIGHEHQKYGDSWETEAGFERFVDALLSDALEDSPRPANYVPSKPWWYANGTDYLGRISLRHRLTPHLTEVGGHIGYDVRPTARRRGYATAMLLGVLPYAYDLGIDEALLTCDVDNVASRKVIEATGGVLEDKRNGKLRYWVPTRKAQPSPR